MSFLAFRLFASIQNDIANIVSFFDDGFLINAVLDSIHEHISQAKDPNDDQLDYGAVNWPDLDVVVQKGLDFWGPRTSRFAAFQGTVKLLRFAFRYVFQ